MLIAIVVQMQIILWFWMELKDLNHHDKASSFQKNLLL
jgi:hypothetical protein